MPLVPDTSTPAVPTWQMMAKDLVIVRAPKPPGSRQLISPPAAVLLIAPAKVLQGAVRLQGLASSPTPETHVRVACACAEEARARVKITIITAEFVSRNFFIGRLLVVTGTGCSCNPARLRYVRPRRAMPVPGLPERFRGRCRSAVDF